MRQTSVINDLLNAIVDTRLFGERRRQRRVGRDEILASIDALLAGRGEVSSLEKATEFWAAYKALDTAGRTFVFRTLAQDYGAPAEALASAATAYLQTPDEATAKALLKAAEPRRVALFRRLNLVRGGTEALVAMRLEIMDRLPHHPDLWTLDDDLKRLFAGWFNRGFLILRKIDWQTSAAILEKIIRYEGVHEIKGWDDLRRRIDVPDRHLFAFFHPRLADEPLIFVEVALTAEIPAAIGPILADEREPIDPQSATTAVFYSISNCQDGLRGISFGASLIKQVAEHLAGELANLKTFVTLSPMPRFAAWVEGEAVREGLVEREAVERLRALEAGDLDDPDRRRALDALAGPLAAHYLLAAKDHKGRPIDPVGRFHLGNGARLERINLDADRSDRGLASAFGTMVNYRYNLDEVEANHEAFANDGAIAAAAQVSRLARQITSEEKAAPARLPPPDAPGSKAKVEQR